MKLCVLGGCGDMAASAVKALIKEPGVEKLAVADLNLNRAQSLAAELGPKAVGVRVDASDRQSLTELVRDYDMALGFVGPFYIFEKPVAEACIEAGTHYLSIADDYDAFLAVSELHGLARDRGVTVITGLGNSPGLTNILARKGYLSMDEPKRIHVQWAGGSNESVGPANLKHLFHIFSGHTLQWLDGGEVKVKTGTDRRLVDFPEPTGRLPVYYTGHAESVSLPRNLPGLDEVTLHGGVHPAYIARLVTLFGSLRLTNTHRKRDILARILHPIEGMFKTGGVDKSVGRIDIHGMHRGRPRHNYYTYVGHIADITSLPLVEGALMLAAGEVGGPGVFAPEAVFTDPDPILNRLKARGVEIQYFEEG